MCADTTAATTAASKMDELIQPQVEIRIHAGNGSFEMRSKFSLERKGDKIICGVREKLNSKTFQKLNQKISEASRVWSFESVFDACYWILDSFGTRWMISKVEARVIERENSIGVTLGVPRLDATSLENSEEMTDEPIAGPSFAQLFRAGEGGQPRL